MGKSFQTCTLLLTIAEFLSEKAMLIYPNRKNESYDDSNLLDNPIIFHHVDKKEDRNWLLTKIYFMISRAGVLFSGIKDKKATISILLS